MCALASKSTGKRGEKAVFVLTKTIEGMLSWTRGEGSRFWNTRRQNDFRTTRDEVGSRRRNGEITGGSWRIAIAGKPSPSRPSSPHSPFHHHIPLHQPTPHSIRYSIPVQRFRKAPVTSLELIKAAEVRSLSFRDTSHVCVEIDRLRTTNEEAVFTGLKENVLAG
ncbi:hypothetical protein EVAR_101819_1 [Eumeta japonica]|uniref:Uncharacterized protein n=1 Tax=Eumeta variegata TaxID=151549 RepID=A0A4C1SQY2_EUMVA|nr:hypothetical protein EVAR_101819_1 [Eumeta japonica]